MAVFTARGHILGGQSALARALMEAVKPPMGRAARAMQRDAKERITSAAPVGSESGKRSKPLSDGSSYRTVVNETPTGFRIDFNVVGSGAFMAKFHATNTGSAGHPIPLRRAKAFYFFDDDAFARGSVPHPGTTGTHWYNNAIEDVLDNFSSYLI